MHASDSHSQPARRSLPPGEAQREADRDKDGEFTYAWADYLEVQLVGIGRSSLPKLTSDSSPLSSVQPLLQRNR